MHQIIILKTDKSKTITLDNTYKKFVTPYTNMNEQTARCICIFQQIEIKVLFIQNYAGSMGLRHLYDLYSNTQP